MKLSIKVGATSVSLAVFIQDSSSTTGAGLTGLAYNTASLTCYAAVPGAAAAAITLATLAAANSAWSSGGFKEIDATNMPGWYRFDVPNTNISTGRSVGIHFKGATNMAPLPLEIELTGWDNQDGVRGGLTALPNAAANAAGGLPVSSAGGLDLDEMNVDIEAIQVSTAGITYTVANQVDVNVVDWKGAAAAAMTGDAYARLGAPAGASVSADVAAIKGDTGTILTDVNTGAGAIYTRIGAPAGASIAADIAAAKVDTAAIKTKTDSLAFTVANQADVNVKSFGGTAGTFAAGRPEADLNSAAETEVTAVPASTAKLKDMIKFLFALARNKTTQTSGVSTLRNNADGASIGTSNVSDDGTTFTRDKWS